MILYNLTIHKFSHSSAHALLTYPCEAGSTGRLHPNEEGHSQDSVTSPRSSVNSKVSNPSPLAKSNTRHNFSNQGPLCYKPPLKITSPHRQLPYKDGLIIVSDERVCVSWTEGLCSLQKSTQGSPCPYKARSKKKAAGLSVSKRECEEIMTLTLTGKHATFSFSFPGKHTRFPYKWNICTHSSLTLYL